MSARAGQWTDDEIDDLLDAEQQAGGDTDLVKNLRAALRTQTKRARDAEGELSTARKEGRQAVLKDLLTARELDAKVAALIPKEVEATKEAVDQWLSEYGDVFGVKPVVQQEAPEGISQEQIAAMRQMDVLAGSASAAATNDVLKQVQGADSAEAIIALINAAGGNAGQ